ncbi:MAG: sigma 54-interacting transcriptional regulator [Myxococcales bacterium]|nr:sigma 54-interacting transcriptional regulator [Myxococcales bacterium]
MSEDSKNGAILTTGGTDGACAAAVLLTRHPDWHVFVTSQNAVGQALLSTLSLSPRPTEAHVCGVGIADPAEVWEALSRLREAGVRVSWYCGREYLDQYRPMLAKICKAEIEHLRSNTALLLKCFPLADAERGALLAELSREYVERKLDARRSSRPHLVPQEHRFFHDLLQAASTRFFQFGDEEPFLRALQKVAGLIPVGDADRREVEVFRRQGSARALPLGTSPAMKALRAQIRRLSPLDEPILILGPTGAGKELVARALHEGSRRKENPFLPVNCAVLGTNADLAHDRLFGHQPGAFTGAVRAGRGMFEAASGGTLFLDEVAELPLPIQTQLLRVIEEKRIVPLGTVEARPVDVRVIAATHRDLPREVAAGRFRADLWYRLSVLPLEVPLFSARLEDAKAIADAVQKELGQAGYRLRLAEADWKAVRAYDWPGNVRQFINVLKRAAYAGSGLREALEVERRLSARAPTDGDERERALRRFWPERPEEVRPEEEIRAAYMRRALAVFGGNRARAAQALGVSENTLRKWVDDRPAE